MFCQEAIYILQDAGLSEKNRFSLKDKCYLGDQLGCKVVPEKEIRTFSHKKKFEFESRKGSYWFLLIKPQEKSISKGAELEGKDG